MKITVGLREINSALAEMRDARGDYENKRDGKIITSFRA